MKCESLQEDVSFGKLTGLALALLDSTAKLHEPNLFYWPRPGVGIPDMGSAELLCMLTRLGFEHR